MTPASLPPVARTRRSRRPPRPRLDSRGPSQGTSADLAAVLQSLEARLANVERQLAQGANGGQQQGVDPNATFGGIISGDLLSDMLQLVSSNGLSGVFSVEAGGTHSLYFLEGQLKHATSGKLSGEDAFYAVFALQQGRYNFTETSELPDEVTINGNTQFLILEALRKIDETRAA